LSSLTVTRDFVRSLARNIREVYGNDVSHTEAIGIVAKSLDWRPDALMHALKNQAAVQPNFEAPDDIPDDLLREWVIRRSWRRAEQAIVSSLESGKSIASEEDRDLALSCLSVCQVVLGNPAAAFDTLREVASLEPLVDMAKALVLHRTGADPRIVQGLLSRSAPKSLDVLFREDLDGEDRSDLRGFAESLARDDEAARPMQGRWAMDLEYLLARLPDPDFTALVAAFMNSPESRGHLQHLMDRTPNP